MKGRATAILILLVVCGCGRFPYPGYRTVGEEVYLKLIALGEGEQLVADADSVRFRVRAALVQDAPGSLLSTERNYAASELRRDAFVPVLEMVHEGDSLSLIAPSGKLPWSVIAPNDFVAPSDTTMVRMELILLGLRTPAMWMEEQERMRRNDPIGFEHRILERYISDPGTEWIRWGTSMMHYRITGVPTDTALVRRGDMVTIEYSGRRLEDGQVFDDSGRNGQSLSFRFGDKDQVVRGIEVAVSLLRSGQQGVFLFPSELAFGAKGIEGVLEPYTAVEYTVTLVTVERAEASQRTL